VDGPRAHWDRPGHFIGSSECQFGMTDVINGYIVSTVGDYRPPGATTMQPIGFRHFYETMVFVDSGKRCVEPACECGLPLHNGRDVDFAGYQTAAEAAAGHARMIKAYRVVARPS